MYSSQLLCLSLIVLFSYIDCLRFLIPSHGKKCLKESVHKNILVNGEYEITETPGQEVDLRIHDSKQYILFQKSKATKGKYSFTLDEFDTYEICFTSSMTAGGKGPDIEVWIDSKHGVEAKNYADIAKAEQLKPLEVELKRLEDLSESIVNDFAYMRAREEEMRDTNESTHTRVLYFSIFSMCCLLGLATWQVIYLRRFFKAKKLIE